MKACKNKFLNYIYWNFFFKQTRKKHRKESKMFIRIKFQRKSSIPKTKRIFNALTMH